MFSFLFIGTAITGSAFLLAGCNYSYSQKDNSNNNENGENNENKNDNINNGNNENNDDIENGEQDGVNNDGNLEDNAIYYYIEYYIWRNNSIGSYNTLYATRQQFTAGQRINIITATYPHGNFTVCGWSTSMNSRTVNYRPGIRYSFYGTVKLYAVYSSYVTIQPYLTRDYSNFSSYVSTTAATFKFNYVNRYGDNTTRTTSNFRDNVIFRTQVKMKITLKDTSQYSIRGYTYKSPPNSTTTSYTYLGTSSYFNIDRPDGVHQFFPLIVQVKQLTLYNSYTINDESSITSTAGGTVSIDYKDDRGTDRSGTLTSSSGIYRTVSDFSTKVTATPNEGFRFKGWYILNSPLEDINRKSILSTYTFRPSAIADNKLFAVFIKEIELTINYISCDATHQTNLSVKVGNLTTFLVTPGNSYTYVTTGSSISQQIITSRSSSSYNYYIGTHTPVSTSTLNSHSYMWIPTVNLTLNFYLAESYTITYNSNNGSGNLPVTPQYKKHDTNITLGTNNLTRTGYTANGWNTNSSGTGTHYNNAAPYSGNGNVTLYAEWKANTYYVKFNGNGSTSGSMNNQTFTYDVAQNLTANAFSKTGYTFAGWATSASGSVVYADKASVKNLTNTNGSTVNLYAKWNTVTYTITYNGNGGSSPSSLSYNIESTSTLASSTRTGYTFNTWKPERTSGNWSNASTYNSGTSVSGMYGDVTLVAQWTAYNYTVIFNKNSSNATGTMSNQTFTYDVSQNLTANAFENDGYSFVGWATSPTGNVIYSNGDSVSNLTSTNNGTVTLYAVWQANLEAKYDTAGGYYYVEIGNMPQTKVTDSSLISQLNSSITNGATYYINGTTMVSKKVNNVEYCKYGNNWYKVEPIRWRLAYSSSQKSGYGTTTDTFAVLDTIVYAGQYSATEIGLNSGYVTTTLDEFKKNVTSTTYLATFSANVESFSPTGTTSKSQSANMFISSADEISSVLNNKTGLSKYSVKFSDLVSDIFGNGIKQYYIRNLGSNISTIKSYTELGMPTQNLCTNLQGVQFTIKVSEYGCIWLKE